MLKKTVIKACLLAFFFSMLASKSISAEEPEVSAHVVGEVITAIGESKLVSAGGQEHPISRGQQVRTGDRIETMIGGHVHIRFIDNGLVSVRPLSRVQIEAYRNKAPHQLAAIKFKLEEGVMRSVTGQWGEANRERFRLNTPLAAIGIKGTDFTVKVDNGNTFASVSTGAIVMSPLEGACTQSLGACQGDASVMLSAEMQGKMLQLLQQNGGVTPRLVPIVDLQAGTNDPAKAGAARQNTSENRAYAAEKLQTNDPASNNTLLGNIPSAPPATAGKPLRWLHNLLGWNVPANSISERFDEALAAGRKATVGNFFITLYRDEETQGTFTPPPRTVMFQLANASATYSQPMAYGLPVENVEITRPKLSVDFSRATFSTQLSLASPSLGQDTFNASGTISKEGYFVNASANQNLAGAFSTDGTQAGYSFDKTTTKGKVSGLTLWGQ